MAKPNHFTSNEIIASINSLYDTVAALGGAVDLVPPVIVNAQILDSNTVKITFSKVVTSSIPGNSIKLEGVVNTITGLSGSGTNTLKFTVNTPIPNESLATYSYDPATGNLSDTTPSANEMATVTDYVIETTLSAGGDSGGGTGTITITENNSF